MKLFYLLLILLFASNVNANSFSCNFEEVYETGEVQNGFFLIKNSQLRYEYFNNNLYTILYVNEKLFSIDNNNRSKVNLIIDKNTLIPHIVEIYSNYPNIKDQYIRDNYEILIEKSFDKFIKRLVIKSDQLNISIFFYNCGKTVLDDKLFNFNPFKEYVFN